MSDQINQLIATQARRAFDQGVRTEQQRILNILIPLAQHDEDMCYFEGKQICYPEDCSAPMFQIVIEEIKGERMTIQEIIEGFKIGVAQMNRIVIKGEQK